MSIVYTIMQKKTAEKQEKCGLSSRYRWFAMVTVGIGLCNRSAKRGCEGEL